MTRLARALLVVTTFLALQASLMGGAAACALVGHDLMSVRGTPSSDATASKGIRASGAMDGMAMVGAPGPTGRMIAGAQDTASSPAPAGDDVPCEHGAAPDCAAMPVCSIFAAPSLSYAHEPGAATARVAPMIALAPASTVIAPELPPPRA